MEDAAFLSYHSPVGTLNLASDKGKLALCWFEEQKHAPTINVQYGRQAISDVLLQAKEWLDCYFSRQTLPPIPKMELHGSAFQLEVWRVLEEIPYGCVTTYGEIAKRIAARRCMPHMSAQAVGGAVGHNPIAVFIPCHRVIAARGIGGYAASIDVKKQLLRIEGWDECACSRTV